MSAPAPRANPDLVGHETAEAEFLAAARRGRLHHAWLITGPAGIGKATLAYRLARWLLAGSPQGESAAIAPADPVFRRIAAGGHADLTTLTMTVDQKTGKLHREILVDDVRAATEFLHRTAIEGGWRILIADPAEALNANAANALLKIVEEPPVRAVLFLVCAIPGRLPATLRSRCRTLRLLRLEERDVARLLTRYAPEITEDERARLVRFAEGSPGRALELASTEGAAIAGLVEQTLVELTMIDRRRAHALADKFGRDENAFQSFMEMLIARLAATLRAAARGTADPGQQRMLGSRSLDAWSEVWQAVSDLAKETARLNLDRRQALVSSLTLLHGP